MRESTRGHLHGRKHPEISKTVIRMTSFPREKTNKQNKNISYKELRDGMDISKMGKLRERIKHLPRLV